MRFAAFLSLGFGTNIAIASVCKPRSRTSSDSSSVSTESVSATSTDIALTTTTYVELSITLTSTGDDKTSTEVTESGSAIAEISASTAIETTATAISTTTAETIATAEATTSADATTTTEATTSADATTTTEDTFVPIPTFNIKALGSDVDGQLLRGDPVSYNSIGWFTPSPPILTFTIEASNNYLREINTGKYLCVTFGGDGFPNSNTLCTPGQMAGIEPLTCEQNRDRKLKCSAPAGECHMNEMTDSTDCYAVSGTWDKFYRIRGRIINTPALVMASSGSPPTGAEFEAIELKLAPYAD